MTFIRRHFDDHGRAPTLRQIANSIGSPHPAAAVGHVDALKKKGLLADEPGHVRLLNPGIPLAGTVGAGGSVTFSDPAWNDPNTWELTESQ